MVSTNVDNLILRISKGILGLSVNSSRYRVSTRKNLSHCKKLKIQNIAKKKNETNRDWLNYKVCVIFKKAFRNIFLIFFYSGGSQERLNEFLESREKMKQILDTQLLQKRKEMLQKFETERLKLLTGKLKKKQDEGKKLQKN